MIREVLLHPHPLLTRRAEPATDGEILTVVATGTSLTVTGSPVGDWIPVDDPVSGLSGYVSTQFVEVPS